MLSMVNGKCEICGVDMGMVISQDVDVTCKKCGHKLRVCEQCKIEGCPKCAGVLLDVKEYIMHTTGNDNIMF